MPGLMTHSGSGSRSRSNFRVEASSVHVAMTSSSGSSFPSPEIQRTGAMPSGTTIEAIAEQPHVEIALGTNTSGVQLSLGSESPDATLSQFLQESSHDQMQHVPSNPFERVPQPQPSSTGPVGSPGLGNTYVTNNQSHVRNELHVSLDPFLVAHIHQVVEQSRVDILSQAQMALDQSREQLRG